LGEQLAEAVGLQGRDALEEYAHRHGAAYPVLYVRLLEDQWAAGEAEAAVATATTALAEVGDSWPEERTAIADLMAQAAERSGRADVVEAAALAGFTAALDLPHYLRLRRVGGRETRERALAVALAAPESGGDIPVVLFLAGEFQRVWDSVKDDRAALGWSRSVKGRVFPLFLALLFQERPLGRLTGVLVRDCWRGRDGTVADELVAVVKDLDRRLPAAHLEQLQDWCRDEVERRVEAIVTAKHRASYSRAADLAVAFAEAVAAGEGDEMGHAVVAALRTRYPRHRSFHQELASSLSRSSLRRR
jgi:hypothetical protein